MLFICVVFIFVIAETAADFTPDFNDFLTKAYGEEVRQELERKDLGPGPWGSFGGKMSPSEPVKRRPVIFVHGVTAQSVIFVDHRKYFQSKGYLSGEMYATSYGDGGKTGPLDVAVSCNFSKLIRRLIVAVHNYTGSEVDLIVWSMGSPVSRKAILGGKCIESNDTLGPPLTEIVDTFVAVGGANYGIQNCPAHHNACNPVNSLKCDSKLMKELNSQRSRFEGRNSYALYSYSDGIIGQNCCGKVCGRLRKATESRKLEGLNHITIFSRTVDVQYKLMSHARNGYPWRLPLALLL